MTKNYTPLPVLVPNIDQKPQNTAIITPSEVGSGGLAYITKKQEYNRFRAMARAGKVTNAVVTAKALGVKPDTIRAWMKTPAIRKAMQESSQQYISTIEQSKDWKAHQYLLERLLVEQDSTAHQGVTNQILIVNKDGQFRVGSQSVEAT